MRGRWVKKAHECKHPVAGSRGVGSIWECKCGKRWEILRKQMVGPYEHVRWGVL